MFKGSLTWPKCKYPLNKVFIISPGKRGYLYNIFLFLYKSLCCGYSLKAYRQGPSDEYPEHMFLWKNKNTDTFRLKKKVPFLELSAYMQICKMYQEVLFCFLFSIKSALLISTHNIGFCKETRKILSWILLLSALLHITFHYHPSIVFI